MNLPNKLTIFRIILVPIMVIIPFLKIPGDILNIPIQNLVIIAIFAIASYTDHLDGKIARKNNLVTTFGKFADPLADKILVLSAMLMLVEMDYLPAMIPIIVLTREFVVSGYRLIAVENGGKVIAASIWGKIKTATQMIAIILALLDSNFFGAFIYEGLTGYNLVINVLSTSLILISTIATVFSGIDYLRGSKELFK
jgi:CDP-diacylglycerol--glycerol-3-phosphate 3-phosphatidyltransferase